MDGETQQPTEEKKSRTRTMTPELLEKLRKAREKAVQIQKERKEIHTKAMQSAMQSQPMPPPVDVLQDPPPPPQDALPSPPTKPSKKTRKTQKAVQKIQRLVEQESSDSSGDDSDPDDVVQDYLKKKYRHKYKAKFEAKINHALLKGQAANHIRNRVSEDLVKLASHSIFGTY